MADTTPSQALSTHVSDAEPRPQLESLSQLVRTPLARQLFLLVGIAAAVAIGVAVVLWSRGPNMGLLYAGLAQKDAADIVQVLQDNQVNYTLGTNGSSIFVPATDVESLRLQLASQGLPQGNASRRAGSDAGNNGFGGMSDAAEANRNRQLLEQDLEHTITSLQSIRSARVHLALPKPSAFIRDQGDVSASVLVELYQGRKLMPAQVAAIVHLVAASVPNLDPSRVSLVDQQGQLLTGGNEDPEADADNERLRLTTRVENAYVQRVERILIPLLGAGHVRAEVHADMDFTRLRQASEVFGKDPQALRSERLSTETRGGNNAAGGVPGALSNQPPIVVQQATAANPDATTTTTNATAQNADVTSQQSTRNFEVDRTVSYITNPAGDIRRLSVAVIVDNKQVPDADGKMESVPLSEDELKHLTELVQSAVGFDTQRGDVVSVINEPFRHDPETGEVAERSFWERPGIMDLIKQGLGVFAVLLLAFGLLRPMMRGLLKPEVVVAQPAPGLPGPDEDDMPKVHISTEAQGMGENAMDQILPGITGPSTFDQKVGMARRVAADNPRQVAQIVKNWVAADGA